MSQPSQPPQPDPSMQTTPSPAPAAEPFVISFPDDPVSRRDWGLWAAVLMLLALVCFWPSIPGRFLWDDDRYVSHNNTLLGRQGLPHIWWPPKLQTVQYYPLTFTSFWIEHQMWTDYPLGYRVVNLLLHAGAVVVLWRVLRRLRLPGAWAIAAIWAVHPLQAETVCWISERKNVLSGVLTFCSLLFYLDFAGLRDPAGPDHALCKIPARWQTYAISLALFIAAVLAKTAVCFLPAALLLILWWKRRLRWETFAGLIPMFVIGAAGGWLTSRIETDPNGLIRAVGPSWDIPFLQQLMIAGHDLWFYAAKLVAPIHLSFNYPRVLPVPTQWAQWLFPLAAVMVIDLLFVLRRALGRGPVVAVLCYVAALFPALGFFAAFPFRYSFVADHLQYLAGIPLIALAVALIARLLPSQPRVLAAFAGVVVLALAAGSWARAKVFLSPTAIWEDTLAKNPGSWLAAFNLAHDRTMAARNALDLANSLAASNELDASLAVADQAAKQLDSAQTLLRQVIDDPAAPPDLKYRSHDELAQITIIRTRWPKADVATLMQHGQQEAQAAIEGETLQESLRPDGLPYYDMGLIKMQQTELMQRAMPAASTAPTSRPGTTRPASPAEQELADKLLEARGYFAKAVQVSRQGLDSPIAYPEAVRVLALAAFQRGNVDFTLGALAEQRDDWTSSDDYARQAVADYGLSVALNDANIDAHYKLALCLEHFHRDAEAIYHLKRTLMYAPYGRFAPGYNEIGRIICASHPTLEQLNLAIKCFRDALAIDPNYVGARENLKNALMMQASGRASSRAASGPATQPSPPPTQPAASRP
ncbi:MAG: hypothetical protein ABR964_10495 [Tepidisphaeraceae bacterium]